MRVFVTGGNGFIGSRLVRRLTEAGHEVRCLLRPGARTHRIDGVPF
ncbi:MAG: NAD-dependent epimerase/dehydratase family protein, partial [Actinomycetota bacterium]|nr:NAD-dependent epimerase/dehydratase family protein [Actinomycetota bacterium]